MSVIPLVLEGPNRTVVESEDEFKRDGDALLILNFDKSQLKQDQPNASYDLRIGRAYRDHREQGERRTLKEQGKIKLLPRGAVLIETEEEIWLPQTKFGYIVPKVKLLQDGVSNTLSKVDPGYHAHLVVTVFNLGQREIELVQGQPFCALVVHNVGTGIKPYVGPGKSIEGRFIEKMFPRLLDRIEARPGLWFFLTCLATIISALAALWSAYHR
jgi:deoxycytidine triphosphate deaminase